MIFPPVLQVLCTKAFRAKTGPRDGHFDVSCFSGKTRIKPSVPLMQIISPTGTDSQSVLSGLAVRSDGLDTLIRTLTVVEDTFARE